MRKIYQLTYLIILAAFIYACGSSEAGPDGLAQLEALKKQKADIEAQIASLEAELVESGAIKKKEGNKVLISAFKVAPKAFHHEVEIRGAVASRKNVIVTAETMGRIQVLKVKEGQNVKKGQLIAQLDADVTRNSIAEAKTQLELAQIVFERQSKLWDQNIGTEIQFLEAKNNKESLERRIATLRSQLDMANVYAPFAAVIDDIPVRVGEVIQPGVPVARLVNQNDTYIAADVSESFLGKFSKGQKVEVYFPSTDKTIYSTIESVGQVIKSENRTFEIEVDLPAIDFKVQPNQVVVLNLVDYVNDKALTVPTKLVQRDSKGNYVYEIIAKDGQQVAKKAHIEVGVSFDQVTEVKGGLKVGQTIALEGYRDLAQNVAVTIAD